MEVAFTKLVGGPHGVGLGVGVGGTVGVAVAVGVGDGPVPQPRSRKIWSGAGASIAQVAPLLPQVVQLVAKPPPGFCQAAPELDVAVRSVQPHWPPTANSIFAWTETQ